MKSFAAKLLRASSNRALCSGVRLESHAGTVLGCCGVCWDWALRAETGRIKNNGTTIRKVGRMADSVLPWGRVRSVFNGRML